MKADPGALDPKKVLKNLLERALTQKVGFTNPQDIQQRFFIELTPEETKDLTYGELIIRQLVKKAGAGDSKSIQEILDRLVGKPTQTIDATNRNFTYNDFLMQCVEADQLERTSTLPPAPKKVIDVTPEQPETDILADLM